RHRRRGGTAHRSRGGAWRDRRPGEPTASRVAGTGTDDTRRIHRTGTHPDAMSLRNSNERWGPVSQLLHWLIVILIVAMAYLGLTMVDLPTTPHKIFVYMLHKSIGITILVLVAMR